MIAVLAAGLPVGSSITASAPNGFQVAAQTTNFTFYTRDAKPVDAEKNQKFLDQISERLGVQVEGRTSYYRYGWPEEIGFVVGTNAAGATMTSGDIHSTQSFDAHEIVHRVAFQLGNPGLLFQEGLAVELGDNGKVQGANVDVLAKKLMGPVTVRSLADKFLSYTPEVRYAMAGSFVHFLVKRNGLGQVTKFFKSCPNEKARDARFVEYFGQSLDDAGRIWAASLAS
jgi:hypothetical protein